VLGLVPELLEAPELFLRTVYIGAQLLAASLAAGLQAATTDCSRVRFFFFFFFFFQLQQCRRE